MKINISDHRKIFAFQEEFNTLFPNLNVEFLSKPSAVGGPPSKKVMKNSKTLGNCRLEHNKGELTLLPTMTASNFMEALRDTYGLSVILYRKSGSKWVEIPDNAAYTLEDHDKGKSHLP